VGEYDAARAGPPRSFLLDGDLYAFSGSWSPLMDHLPNASWRLPLLLDVIEEPDAAVLRERLHDMDDPLNVAGLVPVAEKVVIAATGQPWWVAGKLLMWARDHWAELDGVMTMRGLDMAALIDREPGRACNVVYAHLVDGATKKDRDQFEHSLRQPPVSADPESAAAMDEWFAADEGAAFTAAMGQAFTAGAVRRPPGV
jgi:hypothetical protein